jgi:hypothetical protein
MSARALSFGAVAEAYERIRRALPPTVEITAGVIVHLARRRPER